MAIEDIGIADPQALVQALAAKDTFDFLGSPEGELALAQATIYLATAPKSNAAYVAYKAAMRAAKEHGSLSPPQHILNAPTKLMQSEGYGAGSTTITTPKKASPGRTTSPRSSARGPNTTIRRTGASSVQIRKRLTFLGRYTHQARRITAVRTGWPGHRPPRISGGRTRGWDGVGEGERSWSVLSICGAATRSTIRSPPLHRSA